MRTLTATTSRTGQPRPTRPAKANGFHFIVTSSDLLAKDSVASADLRREQKRQVKSHVSSGRARRARGGRHLPSWVNKDVSHEYGEAEGSLDAESSNSPWLGASLSNGALLSNSNHVEYSVVEEGMKFLRLALTSMYPFSICENAVSQETSIWTHYMLSDMVYLHAIQFSCAAQADALAGRDMSLPTLHHASQTFQLLQKRLDHDHQDISTSDPTIMSVFLLGAVAEQLDTGASVESHVESHVGGLQKMITLRGGFSALPKAADGLWTKVCRLDLALALRRGARPVFFRDDISWDVYVTGGVPSPTTSKDLLSALLDPNHPDDTKLMNIWLDLTSFSSMANLAYQTGRKIPTDCFSEIMVSILYRLLHLPPRQSILQEALRLGMLTYTAAINFQWHHPSQLQKRQRVVGFFAETMLEMHHLGIDVPDRLAYWLLMTWAIAAHPLGDNQQHDARHLQTCLGQFLVKLDISHWAAAKRFLKSVLWIDVLHDEAGKAVYERVRGRTTCKQQRQSKETN